MTTYNTGNPIGSTDVKDLYDNAQNFDTLSTTTTLETVPDRLGVPRMSLHGFEEEAKRRLESIKFQPPIPYSPGIEVTTSSLTVDYLGVLYYALPSALPFTTGAWNPAQWSPLQNTNPGNELLVFDDYASASAAAATLPDGQFVDVTQDQIRYKVSSGSLGDAQPITPLVSNAGFTRSVQDSLKDMPSVKDEGAIGDGVSDDTGALNTALLAPVDLTPGVYSADPAPVSSVGIRGHSAEIKKRISGGNLLSIYGANGGFVSDLNLRQNKGGSSTLHAHHIAVKDGSAVTLRDINILGAEGSGFGILVYPQDIPYQEQLIVQNIRSTYNQALPNNTSGLVFFDRVKNSIIANTVAKGYQQFGAVELKGSASHNFIGGTIADECLNGLYLGSETSAYPSLNVFTGGVLKNPGAAGIVANLGSKNIFSNFVVDFSESEATQAQGAAVYGEGNAFCHLMLSGINPTTPSGENVTPYPVRFRDNAKNNYASVFAQYASTRVATFDTGSKRNFLQLLHPGDKTFIFSSSAIAGSAGLGSIDGSTDSNVVHAPALGQYFGSMSNGFQWWTKNVTLPVSTLVTGDKFRFISDGDVGAAIGGGTTASMKLFKSDGTQRSLYLDASNRVRLSTSSTSWLEFGSTAIYGSTDNTTSLGAPAYKFSVVYAGTGTINTSDARQKTVPVDITDDVLDAWGDVNFVMFKWLESVAEKGDDMARWHFGVIAQQVRDAFINRGLDGTKYGLLCYDEWEDVYEDVPAVFTDHPAEYSSFVDEDGNPIELKAAWSEQVQPACTRLLKPAGNQWGVRPDQCLFLEAAYQRRELARYREEFAQFKQEVLQRLQNLEDGQ